MKKICLFLSTLILTPVYADSPWELVKNEDNIRVYTRHIKNSKYKAFKAEMRLQISLGTLLTVINTPEYCPQWQYHCIKMLNLNQQYIYKLNDLPWPLNDRYTIMSKQVIINTKQHLYTLKFKNIPREQLSSAIQQQLPQENNSVQMRISEGYWQFELSQPPFIVIQYQMHGDPAGIIPANLANQGVINAGFETLYQLRVILRHPPDYQ